MSQLINRKRKYWEVAGVPTKIRYYVEVGDLEQKEQTKVVQRQEMEVEQGQSLSSKRQKNKKKHFEREKKARVLEQLPIELLMRKSKPAKKVVPDYEGFYCDAKKPEVDVDDIDLEEVVRELSMGISQFPN